MHHWHPGQHHHHRRAGPLRRYVRSRLHRRIFVWFASGILLTVLTVAGVTHLASRMAQSTWQDTLSRGSSWLGRQFARDWDNAAARDEFARVTSHDLGVNLTLRAPDGQVLTQVGALCAPWRAFHIPVQRDGAALGAVDACFARHAGPNVPLFFGLGLAVLMLWFASGKVARRITRPLDELTRTVQAIGQGDLTARASQSCRQPDELGVVAEAVNDMAARIEKQLADQKELLAAVSHELRTPLARVRLVSELARDGGATPKTFDDLDREVEEMDALVGELLAKSRLDFGTVARRPMSAWDVSLRALERCGLAEAQLACPKELALEGDPTLLQRALANLLENARTHGGGVERLEVSQDGETVRFSVLDNGPGLPKDTDIFAKFQSGADGLGLGLSLVARIANAHGGVALAENRPEGGARIGFSVAPG